MIYQAKDVGCFAVKFQLFNNKVILGYNKNTYLALRSKILDKSDIKELVKYGKSINIDVFFSVMYPEAVDICEDIGVKYYKIRFKDNQNYDIIQRVLMTDKPFFISTNQPLKLGIESINMNALFCVPKYPALRDDYGLPSDFWFNYKGISDHTSNTKLLKDMLFHRTIPYFEKHVKLDNHCLENEWSVTFEELKEVLKNE
jgi:sialic acid synthase SpsE